MRITRSQRGRRYSRVDGNLFRGPSPGDEKCYVRVTVTVELTMEVTLSSAGGRCWYKYEYDAKVKQKCVCQREPKNKFRWFAGGHCKPEVGGQSGIHDGFTFIMYHPANGTCPPGTCVGESPETSHHFKQKWEVTCPDRRDESDKKGVCEIINNNELKSRITNNLERRLAEFAGEDPLDCPKGGPPVNGNLFN